MRTWQPPEHRGFYGSSYWRKVSSQVRAAHPFCKSCAEYYARPTMEHLEVDHIIPLSKGGAKYDTKNLQVLCRSCHIIKQNANTPIGKALCQGGVTESNVRFQSKWSKTIEEIVG